MLDDPFVNFLPREGNPKAKLDLAMDVKLGVKSFCSIIPTSQTISV